LHFKIRPFLFHAFEAFKLRSMSVDSQDDTRQAAGPDSKIRAGLVRIGVHGQIGRFSVKTEVHGTVTPGRRVLCRTSRGLEVGQFLRATTAFEEQLDGWIVRELLPDDELLWAHLQNLAQEAHEDCARWLVVNRSPAMLLEVEPLMDGRTLYFHFLEDVSTYPGIQAHVDKLALVFEQKAAESDFAARVEMGCGPGCGTENAVNGCGSTGGCAVCKVASACKSAELRARADSRLT
jgi:hypothetical protein